MNSNRFHVLGISGSFRRSSFNSRLIERAGRLAPESVGFDLYEGIEDLPHFTQDCEGEHTPETVLEFRTKIDDADAVLVATPEYNSAMPGVLKNALDWASRPTGESVLAGKPAAVFGASPGRFGATRAQADVRRVLTAIGAEVVEVELAIPRVHELFSEQGEILDAGIDSGLAGHLLLLVETAGGPAPPEPDELAAYSKECQIVVG